MSDTQLFGIGSKRTARSAATTGASIGASIGSRFGPVGAGVASGFGGAVGYLIGSSIDGITPIPDGGRPIDPTDPDAPSRRSDRTAQPGIPEPSRTAEPVGATDPAERDRRAHSREGEAGGRGGGSEGESTVASSATAPVDTDPSDAREPVFIDVVEE
ncbi:MAG: hypothetical protein PPP55_11525 [Halorubrum sp.]